MKYFTLFILILISLIGGQIVWAGEMAPPENPEQLDKFYQKIQDNIINPMKQIPERAKNAAENLMQSFQNKAEDKKEEIKEEIKQEISREVKEQVENQKKGWGDRVKSWLTPLKNKIQEGREALRRWLGKIRK